METPPQGWQAEQDSHMHTHPNENDGNKGWKDDEWQENKNNDEDDDGIVFESSEASRKRKTDEVKKKAENNNDDTTEGGESIDYRLHQRLQQLSINIHSLPVPPTFLYIQTELCKAETLKDWLDKTKIRLPGVISRILREITSALAYIHEKEYIHRDLKPANIFFALDNSVKDHVGSLDAGKMLSTEPDDRPTAQQLLDTYRVSCWFEGTLAACSMRLILA
ncbi:hypothetical protein DPMN_094260 [Dreissena polymorpha]|uniref:Protein kinase domain-containing protein n=1 Tax=Dreissena polymorpha TaxID=45954 RepID=A0A9D4R3D7_DREPO|nr:hypothetical protein DPMN_094260 [Dreissena polymorpha]